MFAAADSIGTISFWDLSKGDAENSADYWASAALPESKLQNISKCYRVKAHFLYRFDFKVETFGLEEEEKDDGEDGTGDGNMERIVYMEFSPDDAYLQVSTNKRLVFLILRPPLSSIPSSPLSPWSASSSPCTVFRPTSASNEREDNVQVFGWTEIDTVGNSSNTGHFSFHFFDKCMSRSTISTGDASLHDKDSSGLDLNESLISLDGACVTGGVLWKVVECKNPLTPATSLRNPPSSSSSIQQFILNNADESNDKFCRVSRQVWTEKMLQNVLIRSKVPHNS